MIALMAVGILLSGAGQAGPQELAHSLEWTAQPTFLSNPATAHDVQAAPSGPVFTVAQPGRGMKWTARLPQKIDLAATPWLVVRYRAVEAAPSVDYFVYLGGETPRQSQDIAQPSDLIADGAWHTLVLKANSFGATWAAIQLQAGGPDARLEIDRFEFLSEPPKLRLDEVLSAGEAAPGQWQPIDISEALNSGYQPLADALMVSEWRHGRLTVSGVPFDLAEGERVVASTDKDMPSELRIPLRSVRGGAVFLLMAAASSEGRTQVICEPHQFSARIDYTKGDTDVCIPARLPSGFGLAPGFAVYAIAIPRDRTAEQITIRDNVKGTIISLLAVTAGQGANVAPHALPAPVRPWEARPYPPARIRPGQPWIGVGPGAREAVNTSTGIQLGLRSGISFVGTWGGMTKLVLASQGSLWRVIVNGRHLESNDFAGAWRKIDDTSGVVLLRDRLGLGISGELALRVDSRQRLQMQLALRPSKPCRMQVFFPTIPEIRDMGKDGPSYCFPRRGAVINNVPIALREAYSGSFPLQFMDVYTAGGGLCLMTQDTDCVYRYFNLTKDDGGVSISVEYLEQDVGPANPFQSVTTLVGFHDGDWHTAFDLYREWLATWRRPDAPRKDWFRRVFNFRQQFMRFYIPGGERYYDKETKRYSFPEGIAEDARAFGGVDYLHLFDWGASSKWGRTGDYDPWDEIGGVDAFRDAVRTTQAAGIPVGLYIEGYLVEPNSRIAQAHGKEWEMLGHDGKGLPYYAPAMNMCSAVAAWQDYLSGVYARVRSQTGAMGYYCDQMGFADPGHFCYAANHGHGVPEPPLRGQRDLLKKIRAALGPDAALYTEETPVDAVTGHTDGSFTYAISSVSDAWSPSHINLTRFAFPDFKTFEIIVCDRPLADRLTAARQIFFNGEGIWLEGPADKWFAPEVREHIAKMHSVMRRHEDCFTSLACVPLVPTGQPLVFANEFPGSGRTLWTLFNANHSTVRGELLAVRHIEGARYHDAWNDRLLDPRIENGVAYITLEIGPKDVGCVTRSGP